MNLLRSRYDAFSLVLSCVIQIEALENGESHPHNQIQGVYDRLDGNTVAYLGYQVPNVMRAGRASYEAIEEGGV